MSWGWIIWWVAAVAVLAFVSRRYWAGIVRLRRALRRVACGDWSMPLLLDLPRGLRAAEFDLKAIAARLLQLERAAAAERYGLESILGSIPEGVFIVDRKMHIRLANPGVEAMFGLKVSPAGRTVMEAFRSHDIHRLVEESFAADRAHHGEVVVRRDGAPRTFELSISPLPLSESETGAVVVAHNITRIKSLEGVRREFVANVSHELRTPLTIINGYLETLLEGGLEDRAMAENALGVMFKHGDRLKHLVDDLLVISQAESRSVRLDPQPVDLRDVIRRVVAQLDEPIRARGAEVRVTSADADTIVQADAPRLEQVFLNLLENALKYGQRPGLCVNFYVERAGSELHVQVSDNGPGIPYEDQEHIFERFYRVHKDRSRATGGTGLGLSIVKSLVEAHGGRVSLQSIPGAGSTFHVIIPTEPVAPLFPAA